MSCNEEQRDNPQIFNSEYITTASYVIYFMPNSGQSNAYTFWLCDIAPTYFLLRLDQAPCYRDKNVIEILSIIITFALPDKMADNDTTHFVPAIAIFSEILLLQVLKRMLTGLVLDPWPNLESLKKWFSIEK